MSKIAVMTDSTCGLSPAAIARYDLIVVPCQVRIGDSVYREGVDLTAEQLFQRMFTVEAALATSLPAGADYAAAYDEAVRRGADQVLGIFVGSELSGTFNGARLAAMDYDLEVELVDSGTTSLALGLLVIRAARRVAEGASPEEAAAVAREEARQMEAYALLDTLEYIRRGGRIGRVGELIAHVLNIKPILRVGDNAVVVAARVRSYRKGVAWLKAAVANAAPVRALGLIHTGGESAALVERLAAELRVHLVEGGEVFVEPASSALAVHIGPNGIGVMFLR